MEYEAKLTLVFILLFIGMWYVIYIHYPFPFLVKPPEEVNISFAAYDICDINDGFVGDKFCSNENVFQKYRDYYTRDNNCTYGESNKLVEDCNAKDGWVDGRTYKCCDGNSKCTCKDQEYHDYSCSYGQCLKSVTQKRTLKSECINCKSCRNGECIDCESDSDCGSSDWISSPQCSGNDVYQKYRTYECRYPGTESSYCTYYDTSKFKQDCGETTYTNWITTCKYGDVYRIRNYYDRGCSDGKCYSNWRTEEELQRDCRYGCLDGYCISCSGSGCGSCTSCDSCQGCQSCSGCGTCTSCQSCSGTDTSCGTYPNCNNCNSNDGYVGSRFCSGNNVYQKYRDYYCSGNSCTYTESDKLIESCSYSCSDGSCSSQTCSGTDTSCGVSPNCNNCNNNDGYVGSRYCSGNNVYQRYRDYYCSGNSCTYSESDKFIEYCSNGCSNGYCNSYQSCSGTDTSCGTYPNCNNCNNNDGYIGSRYCSGNNVYQTYRDYYCYGNSCYYTDREVLIQSCSYGCSGGYCTDCYGYDCGYSCSYWGQCGTYPNCYTCGCYGSGCYDYSYDYYYYGDYWSSDYYCDNCYDNYYDGGYYYGDYWGGDYYCDNCYDGYDYSWNDDYDDGYDWSWNDGCYCDGCQGYDYCCDYCSDYGYDDDWNDYGYDDSWNG